MQHFLRESKEASLPHREWARRRVIGDNLRSEGLPLPSLLWNQTDRTSYPNLEKENHLDLFLIEKLGTGHPTLPNSICLSDSLEHPLCLLGLIFMPVRAHSCTVDLARKPRLPNFKALVIRLGELVCHGHGHFESQCDFIPLSPVNSDTCLQRLRFLSWRAGCGQNPDVLVFLTRFGISLWDISKIWYSKFPSSHSWLLSFYRSGCWGIYILAEVKVTYSSLGLPSSKALLSGIQGHVSVIFFIQFWSRSVINCMWFVLTLTVSAWGTFGWFGVHDTPLLSQWEYMCTPAHTEGKVINPE